MYSTILCFLIAVTIHVLAPQNPDARWNLQAAALMATILGGSWLYVRVRMRRYALTALSGEGASTYLRPRFTKIIQDNQTLLLAPFAFFTYATDYNSLAVLPLAGKSQALGGFLGLLPYFLMWTALWREAYPLKSVLFGRDESRASFVKSHARMEGAAVVPWFAILILGDLISLLWPDGIKFLDTHPVAQLFYAPVFLTLAALFMPLLVKRIWGCQPVPPGPLRDKLQADVDRLGLKVREILFWPLLGGRLITAGIFGPAPRFRYLLVTPALASLLDADEMTAVVAHETGHVKHNHLWFYLLYFSGILVGGLAIYFQLSSAAIVWLSAAFPTAAQSQWASSTVSLALTAGMGVVIFIGFRVLFGKLSRAFERQADLFALEAMGRPGPILSALDAIASHSGDIRDLPSWHHGSISERLRFISDAAVTPEVGAGHHRSVTRLKILTGILIAVLFAGAALLQLPEVQKNLAYDSAISGAKFRVALHPEDWRTLTLLGDSHLALGREREALDAYYGALTAKPDEPNALNNAAWILATTDDASLADPEKAVELARRAVLAAPLPHVLDTLAEALHKNGDIAEAIRTMEAAISLTPANDPNRPQFIDKLEELRRTAP